MIVIIFYALHHPDVETIIPIDIWGKRIWADVNIESTVLEKIRPTEDESAHIMDVAGRLKDSVEEYLRERNETVEVRFVGSVAKGTFLSDPDIDIFLLFPSDVPREELENVGLMAGEEVLHGERMYSEHPYTRGVFEGIDVDMVPCYSLESTDRLLSSVDRTPFHTNYILNHITEEQKDQVRLLKVFMKGIGTYGAEPNTRGFSGYLCELLIIRYGSFRNVIKEGALWKAGVTITIDVKGPPMTGPMVVYDPVDPKRNVASAVHIDALSTFIVACKAYEKEPSEDFFFPCERVPMGLDELRRCSEEHGSRLLTVMFERPDSNSDNIHSQIWKTQYALEKKLNLYSFNVIRAVHDLTDRIYIIFELERDLLSKTFKHVGPPVWVRSADSFLQKWMDNPLGRPFIEEGQWTVVSERRHDTAAEMISDEAAIAGIGREIDLETMKLLEHDESMVKCDPLLLTELFDPRHPWEIRRRAD